MRFSGSFWEKLRLIYVATFIFLILVLSFFSVGRLILVYKSGEVINNEASGQDNLESDLVANVIGKNMFLNLNGGMRVLLGQNEMNGVTMLNNGYLAEVHEPVDEQILESNAQNMALFQQKLQERGIPSLYVLTPYKINAKDPQLPYGVEDYTNQSLDILVKKMEDYDVEMIDLRTYFSSEEQDFYSLFYRTDHHWNTYGGFFAYRIIAERMAALLKTNLNEELLSIESFKQEVYPAWHLGSYGKRTGEIFAGGADDFVLFLPKFSTNITNNSTGEEGSFEQILVNKSYLEARNLQSDYIYDWVLPLGSFHSSSTGCGKKVLLVCDSMGRAVLPYLTLAFGDVQYVYGNPPEGVTTKLLDQYQPDIVVVMHYAPVALTEAGFDFPIL